MGDADKEFKVRITTPADTSGIDETEKKLDRLKGKAGSGFPQPGQIGPVPAELFGAPPIPTPEVAAAAKELEKETLGTGVNLTRASQEAIILARELATGVPTTRTLSSLLGSLGYSIAGGAVAGLALFEAIGKVKNEADEAAKHIEKINELTVPKDQFASVGELETHLKAILPELEAIRTQVNGRLLPSVGELANQFLQGETAVRTIKSVLESFNLGPVIGQVSAIRDVFEAAKTAGAGVAEERNRELLALLSAARGAAESIVQQYQIAAGIQTEIVGGSKALSGSTEKNVELDQAHLDTLLKQASIYEQFKDPALSNQRNEALDAESQRYQAQIKLIEHKHDLVSGELDLHEKILAIQQLVLDGQLGANTAKILELQAKIDEANRREVNAPPGSDERRKAHDESVAASQALENERLRQFKDAGGSIATAGRREQDERRQRAIDQENLDRQTRDLADRRARGAHGQTELGEPSSPDARPDHPTAAVPDRTEERSQQPQQPQLDPNAFAQTVAAAVGAAVETSMDKVWGR